MYRRDYLALVMIISCLMGPAQSAAQESKATDGDSAGGSAAAQTGTPESKTPAPDGAPKSKTSPKGSKEAPAKEPSSGEAGQPQGDVPPPPTAAPPESLSQTGTYTVRLRDLEDRINRLKEQIFRSKARLSLLAETVLDRKIAGSKAIIVFKNEVGGSFRLIKATFLLDGGPIFNKADEGGNLAERDVINLYDGPVMPGEHTLSTVLHYRGHGYGIFSYLRGYSFKTRSSRTFTVNEGKAMKLEVIGYEKGGVTTPLEDRPDVRYLMNVVEYDSASQEKDASGDSKKE